jgi:hypothetical protein
VEIIKDILLKAQNRMKKYAYMRRKERGFDVGDNQKPSVSSSDSELKLFENLKAQLQSLKKKTQCILKECKFSMYLIY